MYIIYTDRKDTHFATKKGSRRRVEYVKVSDVKARVESQSVQTRQTKCLKIRNSKFSYLEKRVEFF